MATKWMTVLIVLLLVLGACAGDSTEAGVAESDVDGATSAADDSTDSDSASTDDNSDGSSDSTDSGTDSSAIEVSAEPSCVLSDDGVTFETRLRNDGAEATSYGGTVGLFDGDSRVGEAVVKLVAVQPGEVVREYAFTSVSVPLTSCDASAVVPVDEPIELTGIADVAPCVVPGEGEFGNIAFTLDVTNASEHVTAGYTFYVALRDGDNQRVTTTIALAKFDEGTAGYLAPGEQWTETLTSHVTAPWEGDHSCEVVYAEKQSDEEFLSFEGGVEKGTLSADVGFVTGSAELTPDALVLLAGTSDALARYSGPVCVEGFADSVGDDASNLTLSQDRAEAVADVLRERGAANEIEAVGHGESLATTDEVDDPTLRRVDVSFASCDTQ